MKTIHDNLLTSAKVARKQAYAPYSNFTVGAAILCENGYTHTGGNVENAAYPDSICAEAAAIGAMIASGARKIIQICIVCEAGSWAPPCGGCRQKIREFSTAATQVFVYSEDGQSAQFLLNDLLPNSFGPDSLPKINKE